MIELLSGLLGGICLGLFCIMPIIPFLILYIQERKKDPIGMKKAEQEFMETLRRI